MALQHFKAAAGSGSTYGKEAAEEYVRLDLPENPGNYVAALVQTDATGKAYVIIENRAPVALANIVVTPVLVDANGRVLQQGSAVQIRGPVPAGERASAAISTGNLTGIVPAGKTLVIDDLKTVLTGFSAAPRATINVTVAGPNNQIQGLYQIVNPDKGSISNHVLVRPGSN